MRITSETLHLILMAHGTGLLPGKVCRVHCRPQRRRCRSLRCSGMP
jgi:hypothetical protein